jgi:elongator complex protein 2
MGDAGAQCLGYFGSCFSPDGEKILAHGFTGALHLWQLSAKCGHAGEGSRTGQDKDGESVNAGSVGDRSVDNGREEGSSGLLVGAWEPRHAAGGHFGGVVGCCWAADGSCLLSVGRDQTARIFTQVQGHWCELSRPQV